MYRCCHPFDSALESIVIPAPALGSGCNRTKLLAGLFHASPLARRRLRLFRPVPAPGGIPPSGRERSPTRRVRRVPRPGCPLPAMFPLLSRHRSCRLFPLAQVWRVIVGALTWAKSPELMRNHGPENECSWQRRAQGPRAALGRNRIPGYGGPADHFVMQRA